MPEPTTIEKAKVLVFGDVNRNTSIFEDFSQRFDHKSYKLTTKKQFITDIKTKYSDIHAYWLTWESFMPIGGMDKELVSHLPSTLKIIVICSVGFDNFDTQALSERGIILCNAPGLAASPVADHVLYQTLGLYRFYGVFERLIREHGNSNTARASAASHDWDGMSGKPILHQNNKSSPSYNPNEDHSPGFSLGARVGGREVKQPRGSTVGIVGFGAIGKEIGHRLSMIGMKVHYTKRTPLTTKETLSMQYPTTFHDNLESLLEVSDLVVLACPLTEENYHMINKKTIEKLPNGAKIINIGRGGLVDTEALIHGLNSGKLHGAALDVFETEPLIHSELRDRWDVILTPHIGSSTIDISNGAERTCVDNLINCLYGNGKSTTRVN